MFKAMGACCAVVFVVWTVVATAADPVGPAWPNEPNDSTASPLSARIDQFDRALEILRDHLQLMRSQVQQSVDQSRPTRRGEPGFRGIYVMNRDGSSVEFLAAAPGMLTNADPQWSNDGRMVAFGGVSKIDQPVEGKVYVYAIEGPFKGSIRDYGHGNTPAWSPDDRQIAYMINDGNPIGAKGGTWVMNADGSNRRWLARAWFPRWSPDGKSLLSHGLLDDGSQTLVIVDPATRHVRTLLKAPGWELKSYGGNWSPDGKQVIFIGTYQGQDRLATIDPSGDDDSIRILHTNEDSAFELLGPPAWSPDGRQIVFVKQAVGQGPRRWWKSYLYSMAADIPSAPVLLEGKAVGNINRGMAFSPDSKMLLFSSER